ncbi:GGDEF domain-containing protein [Mobilicoccus pelagius]|uniref:Signaling protein n=1 Tax=Mobilicoccus pelagius NBRC 104925 TaxID=1089455 RepID=H5UPW2_9MICO|nr:diguanylate cyclase [Mobilicoccus pelagius]GAB47767.1 hypothetical protein MOPEL_029_00460 [Mobilicoccus pelagius NBRC 104925]
MSNPTSVHRGRAPRRCVLSASRSSTPRLPRRTSAPPRPTQEPEEIGGRVTALDRILFALGLGLIAATMVIHVDDPDGVGEYVYAGTSALLLLVAALGPILRRARPRRAWLFGSLGAFLFACSSGGVVFPYEVGPFELTDMSFFGGYLALVVLFVRLTRLSSPRRDDSYLPDALAGTAGVALALWPSVLAPLSTTDLPGGVVWAAYPPLDATVLALAIHLTLRLGRVTRPLGWFLVSLLLGFTLDTVSTVWKVLGADSTHVVLETGFLLGHFTLACALCHPALNEQWERPAEGSARRHPERSAAFAVLTLSPAILAITIPVVGHVDAAVRALFVVVILALLFVRMHRTLQELSRAEEDSHHRATHDELTGLLNRPALLAHLARRREIDRRLGRHTVVLFLDCDDFKSVNDTWGHVAGDTLLQAVADRFRSTLARSETPGRLGGDEFVVVGSVVGPEAGMALATQVRRLFDEPLVILPGRVHAMTPSIGVAVADPEDDVSTDTLLVRADLAMYEAKQQGKGRVVVFGEVLERRSGCRTAVAARLADALRTGTVDVVLRPIMGGPDYVRLAGWEACPRWDDAELGAIEPEMLIALAGRLDLSRDLDQLVLRRIRDRVAAHRLDVRDVVVHVDVSPSFLRRSESVGLVREIVGGAGLPPGHLHLQVPESTLIDPDPEVRGVLEVLRRTGALLCATGVGAGRASLPAVLSLAADAATIDRSLLTGLGEDEEASRRYAAVLGLLRGLGTDRVVADGVTTAAQEAELLRLGCPTVRGPRYDAPIDADSTWRADAAG